MTTDCSTGFESQFAELRTMLIEIRGLISSPTVPRESYSVEEAAALLGRGTYTVREWCRNGRINATKRAEKRGGAALWSISADEIRRFRDEGQLEPDPYRNQRN
jgi:excisionase family DNA binding protein